MTCVISLLLYLILLAVLAQFGTTRVHHHAVAGERGRGGGIDASNSPPLSTASVPMVLTAAALQDDEDDPAVSHQVSRLWIIVGMVVLCVLLFGVIPAVLYYTIYRGALERRHLQMVREAEEHERAMQEMQHSEAEGTGASGEEQNGDEDYVDCKGIDMIIYNEDGEHHYVSPEERRQFRRPVVVDEVGCVVPRDADEGWEPEKVQGIAIRSRIHPRRHLPRKKVVVAPDPHTRIEIRFNEDARVPDADPPPLSKEEREKREAELRRVDSPVAYGRAAYQSPTGVTLSVAALKNLSTRAVSPVAFSLGPSPATSLRGSFASQCRYRRENSAGMRPSHGGTAATPRGAPHLALSTTGSIGGGGPCSRPSSYIVPLESSDEDDRRLPSFDESDDDAIGVAARPQRSMEEEEDGIAGFSAGSGVWRAPPFTRGGSAGKSPRATAKSQHRPQPLRTHRVSSSPNPKGHPRKGESNSARGGRGDRPSPWGTPHHDGGGNAWQAALSHTPNSHSSRCVAAVLSTPLVTPPQGTSGTGSSAASLSV